jgi:2-polyprenyl-6-methoxyphenol hydroxylase-like FAD-dependent oxidoreductase
MLPERTSVLIVGAGPAGLATAASLFHHGCKDIVIVDAIERTPDTSRAMAIHAATLEVRNFSNMLYFTHFLAQGS